MRIRKYTVYIPSRKNMTGSDLAETTKPTPEESLVVSKKKHVERNAQGRITVRHRGSGARRRYRIIDFKRNLKGNISAKVVAVEYGSNRTANIVLLCYADGAKACILASQGPMVGQAVMNGDKAEVRVGDCFLLVLIPVGSEIHNIELYPGEGAQLAHTTGITAQLMAKEGKYVILRLPSGEMRMVPTNCRATVDSIGNGEHNLINLDKADRERHMGIRPTAYGFVMSPNDHPYGGGEGRAPIGRPGPCISWDKLAMGFKTRKKNKQSNKLIARRRNGRA